MVTTSTPVWKFGARAHGGGLHGLSLAILGKNIVETLYNWIIKIIYMEINAHNDNRNQCQQKERKKKNMRSTRIKMKVLFTCIVCLHYMLC